MEIVGVFGGLLCGLIGWYAGRRQARKKNGLDEMYEFVMEKSRSYSWFATLVAIYVFLLLAVFDVTIGMIPTLSILLLDL